MTRGEPMDQLDGAGVRTWAVAAADALARSATRIDALNVFPVPDADTGTNVRLTVAGGALAVGLTAPEAGAAEVARAFARGCLRAARGNSGVIVSQFLAGFAAGLEERHASGDGPRSGATVVAEALVRAAAESAGAVATPQEGTILTVARQVGDDARRAAEAGVPLRRMLTPVIRSARSDLALVSSRNPVLRDAGLVDAGACALLVLLDALDRTLGAAAGQPPAWRAEAVDWLPAAGAGAPVPTDGHGRPGGGTFEVMMLIRPSRPDSEVGDRLRSALSAVGDSVAVVGADDLWHLHVHTDRPDAAIAAAAPAGSREQVVVRLVEGAAAQVAAGDDLGVVIGTSSPGTAGWFATGGAVVVVRCAEAPVDAGHLARAAADTGADHVVVLPGVADVVGAACALADPLDAGTTLPGVQVEVVETAVGVLATAVASLAVLGGRSDGPGRAEQARAAVARLRTRDVDVAEDVDEVLHAVEGLLADAVSAQAVTVQHAGRVADAGHLLGALTRRYPDLDAVLVGPVGSGPAWRIGVD